MGSEQTEAAGSAAAAAAIGTEPEGAAAGGAPALTPDDLRFDVLRNAAYHGARQAWFGGLHRATMFVTALAGTAAVGAALANNSRMALLPGLVTAVAAMLDLVFRWSERAAVHARLRERVFNLLADVEEADGTPEALRRAAAAMTRLYGEEPVTMCAVDALAQNAAKAATTRDLDPLDLIVVPRREYYARHLMPCSGAVFLTRREMEGGGIP